MTPLELKRYYSSEEFKNKYIYNEKDLGITYLKDKTVFKLWAPTAAEVVIRLYNAGSDEEADSKQLNSFNMKKSDNGIWEKEIEDDLDGVYYDYRIKIDNEVFVSADPYAIACGVNGNRSMVIDLNKTDPIGWNEDSHTRAQVDCPIIYELHIKDFSYDKASGISDKYRGKYLAFTENGTTLNNDNVHKTGIDYLKELGITHVHILPAFDYASVDESKDDNQFNWGYDPLNYNVPEGSYSTNPFKGDVRIREFKEMVLALHNAGISVVMDVVYNHTYSLDSWFQKTVPYYYYRQNEDGTLCNGSACGNDTASERKMFGNYMKNSILYWADEYHIDGFRFDLMGLHNVELMNEIRQELDKLPNGKNILMYGEPWAADESPMEENAIPALKKNIDKLDERIAIFCDSTRDAIKGHVFYGEVPGFVNGGEGFEEDIKSSVRAWCNSVEEWNPKSPKQIISYVSAHDNFTLYDKLVECLRTEKDYRKRDEELIRINKLVAAIVFTCQGTVFFQAGEEFARTKLGEDNSYNLSPELNKLDWTRAYEYSDLVEYYKGLIKIRNNFSAFYNGKLDNVDRIKFLPVTHKGGVIYTLQSDDGTDDLWNEVYVAYNSTVENIEVTLPNDKWQVLADSESSSKFEKDEYVSGTIKIQPQSALILGR